MPGIGKNRKASFVLTIILVLIVNIPCKSQYFYYTCSYKEPVWNTDVLFSKIDLQAKTIMQSISISLAGEIQTKSPIEIERGNNKFYFISTFNGLAGKNSHLLSESVSNYAIINEGGNIVRNDQIPNTQLLEFKPSPTTGKRVKFLNDNGQSLRGILTLNNQNRATMNQIEDDPYNDSDYPIISGFRYFKKINNRNDRLYWNTTSNGQYLLSIDISNNILIDSLSIEAGDYSNLYGISDNDSMVYVFYMNHNYLGSPSDMQKLEIDQSYVKIFAAADFSLLDSVDFAFPRIDFGYVGRETGSVDKIGPYFVYYFFSGEDYRYFSPAMLFIFDTRTNETTWLRVGWR